MLALDNSPELTWEPLRTDVEVGDNPEGTSYEVIGYQLERISYQRVPGSSTPDKMESYVPPMDMGMISGTTHRDQGLPYSSYFKYRVRAEVHCTIPGEEGDDLVVKMSPWSNEVTTTTASSGGRLDAVATSPGMPEFADADFVRADPANQCVGGNVVELSWAAPENPGREGAESTGTGGQYVGGDFIGGDNAGRVILGGPAEIRSYTVERRVVGGATAWETVERLPATAELAYTDEDVDFGSTYVYRITVTNSARLTNSVVIREIVPLHVATPPMPDVPTSLVAVVLDDGSIELQWDPPAQTQEVYVVQTAEDGTVTVVWYPMDDTMGQRYDKADLIAYEIRRQVAQPESGAIEWTDEDTLAIIEHQQSDAGITVVRTQEYTHALGRLTAEERGNVLTYQVRAIMAHHEDRCVVDESAWVEADSNREAPNVPDVPGNLRQTDVTSDSITVAWDAPVSGGSPILGYTLLRKAGEGDYVPILGTSSDDLYTGTSYIDRGLEPNTVYQYRVHASNQVGQSDLSNTLTVPTDPDEGPVGAPDITGVTTGADSLSVTWTDGVNAASHMVLLLDTAFNLVENGIDAAPTGNMSEFTGLSAGTYTVVVLSIHADGTYMYKTETAPVP